MDVFDLFAKISIDTSEYDRGLSDASNKTSSFGDKLKSGLATAAKFGMAAIGTATTAVTGFAASSVKVGMDFDSAMSQVAATMLKSMDEMNSEVVSVDLSTGKFTGTLRDFAKEMGSTTAFSATEAANALNYMALAGYDTETSMKMLPNVLNLAAAGGIDLASASDMVTDAQSALGLSLDETAEMVDKMAQTASKSNTSVAQLGEAYLVVGGTAKNLAGGTTELSTALGILADNGIKGGEGGTALRNIMLSLSAPTDKAAKLMNSLGLEVYDANGNMRPLNETFGDLNSVLSTMTQGEQTQVLNSIFNKVDLKSVNSLLAGTASGFDGIGAALHASSVDWESYVDDIRARTGDMSITTEDLFNDISNFLTGMLELGYDTEEQQKVLQEEFGLTAEDAAAAIESVNTSVVESGTRWDELTGYINNAEGAAQAMADIQLDNLEGDVIKFKSALEGAQIAISDQLTPTLREFTQFGTDAISTLSTAFQEGGLTGAMEALGTILSDGLNMVIEQLPQMVDAGMQLLGALGQGLLDNLPAITDAAIEIVLMLADGLIEARLALDEGAVQLVTGLANGIGEALPELIPKAVEAVATFLEGLTNPESLNNLIGGALTLIEGLGEGIIKAIPLLIEYGPEIVVNIVTGLISALPQLITVGGQLIMGLVEGLIQAVVAIPTAIAKVASAIVDGFKALFGIHSPSTVFAEMGGFLIDGLLQGISETWGNIVEFFSGAAEGLINFLGESWDTIKEAASVAWEAIKEVFVAAWEGIQSAWGVVIDFFSGIWDGIQGVFSVVADILGGFFSAAWEAVQSAWSGAVEFFGGLWNNIQTAAGEAAGAVSGALSDAWNAVTAAWSAAVGFFSSLWSGITSTFAGAASWFGDKFSAAWDAVTSAWSGVTTFFSGVWDKITSVFSSVGDKFKSIGKSIVDGLKNGVLGAWNSFIGFITDKVGGIVNTVKNLLGIHSPSTVFAGIGGNMALGLAEGWDDEYSGIKRKIENGLNFGTATVGLSTNYSGAARYGAQEAPQRAGTGWGNTYVTINSPVAVDGVQAAREWQKTAQRMALGYV